MPPRSGPMVLAIGVDAAEPRLMRRLIDRGAMPTIGTLLKDGATWLTVKSPAHIGSGAVWPTFITGSEPAEHGIYGEWCWQPDTMGLMRYNGRGLKPFWERLVHKGMVVGVFDVPFAPLLGFSEGFEISEWGAHDALLARTDFAPAGIAPLIDDGQSPHPLSEDRLDASGPDDYDALTRMSTGCLQGVRMRGALAERLIRETRPRLAVCVFPEIHHAAHHLWHTIEPDHELYEAGSFRHLRDVAPTLEDIYQAFDREVARLIEAADDDAAVMVFSLHGMQPARGIPAWLPALLCEKEFAALAGFGSQAWAERAASVLAIVKRATPTRVKRLYYRGMPTAATQKLAQPTMMPAYDWSRTRAFALPTDQHGWVRVNLAGREAKGCVGADEYESTCREVEAMLRSAETDDRRPIVRDVIRTTRDAEHARASRLPDLVVHWHDAAFDRQPTMRGVAATLPGPVGLKFTGQHAMDGFCVMTGARTPGSSAIGAGELHRLILAGLAAP